MWVSAGHSRDLHPLENHMTKLRNFTKEENQDFSAIGFSLHLMLEQAMLEQALINLIVHKNYKQKLYQRASMLQWILGSFGFSQN